MDELCRRGCSVADRASMVSERLRRRDFGLAANAVAAVVPGWREAFLSLRHGMDDWIRFVVRHPGYAALVHEWLAEGGPSEEWRRCVFHAVLTTAFESELAGEGEGRVLLDEGFGQRFFTLRGNGDRGGAADAERYVERMPRPSGLVWISADPEECLARLTRRPRLPLLMENETREVRLRRLTRGNAWLGALAAAAEMRGIPVLRIEGDGSVKTAGRLLADFTEEAR
jgi:hypothetical protein